MIEHENRSKIVLAALKLNGMNLKHVSRHTIAYDITAVMQNGEALQYVKGQVPITAQHALWDPRARKYAKFGLNLPSIYYQWYHHFNWPKDKKDIRNIIINDLKYKKIYPQWSHRKKLKDIKIVFTYSFS